MNGPTGGTVKLSYVPFIIFVFDSGFEISHQGFGIELLSGILNPHPCFNFFVHPKYPFHTVVKYSSDIGLF